MIRDCTYHEPYVKLMAGNKAADQRGGTRTALRVYKAVVYTWQQAQTGVFITLLIAFAVCIGYYAVCRAVNKDNGSFHTAMPFHR